MQFVVPSGAVYGIRKPKTDPGGDSPRGSHGLFSAEQSAELARIAAKGRKELEELFEDRITVFQKSLDPLAAFAQDYRAERVRLPRRR